MLYTSPHPATPPRDDLDETDAALVAAARKGDEGASFRIWSRYAPFVRRLIRAQSGGRGDADDLAQEVFLRVFSRLAEIRDPNALRGFVAGICLGVMRNANRRGRIRAILRFAPDESLPEVLVPGIHDESRQVLRHLQRLLDAVSPEDRSLFICRYVERIDIKDIAMAHGMRLGTAKRRVARMTRRISAAMQHDPVLAAYAHHWMNRSE